MPSSQTLDEALGRLFASEPDAMADAPAVWRRLHEEAPIHRFGASILISRYADVKAIHLHGLDWGTHGVPRNSTEADAIVAQLEEEDQAVLATLMEFEDLFLSRTGDRERHDRLRQIAHPIFTPRRIAEVRELTELFTDKLLASVEGDACDLSGVCDALPLMVIGSILGVPEEDLGLVRQWSTRLAAATHRNPPNPVAIRDGLAAIGDFRAYVAELVEHQRRQPEVASAFVEAMLAAESEDRATQDEVTAMFITFLFAGHETTSNLLAIGIAELLRSRDQWTLLVEQPALVVNATEELLRHVSPAQFGPMNATTDFELGGTHVQSGDTVMPMIGAANRDPAVFLDPDRLDVTRSNCRDHQAFGLGPRYCIGQALSRMEAQIAFAEVTRRFPDMELAADRLEWNGVAMLRRLKSLPVSPGRAVLSAFG